MAVESPDSFPAAQANARFRLAELLYLSEEFEAALQQYAALQFAPELNAHQLSEAHLNRGICLMRLGRLEQARIALDACRESASHSAAGLDVKADLCLAECFEIQKDIPSARECYNRIIHNPSTEPATKAAALTCLRRL
jgi:tetratricopeptide (TPR) repeat protein